MKEKLKMVDGVSQASAPEAREDERGVEERGGESESERAGEALGAVDPEVPERAVRRRFSAKYKLKILREADRCTDPGQLGTLLRREGLYSSNLTTWRKQRERGELEGLAPKKRGRKAKPVDPNEKRIRQLKRENEGLKKKLEKAEIIIEFQKKVSEILGISLENNEEKS